MSSFRFRALEELFTRQPVHVEFPSHKVSDYYGSSVFNKDSLKQHLTDNAYKKVMEAIANGGRYDDIGSVFGRARPATGFSADLKVLSELSEVPVKQADAILMPIEAELTPTQRQSLWEMQSQLRQQGECVLAQLSDSPVPANCARQLVWQDSVWTLVATP